MNNENFNIAPNDENEEFTVEFGEIFNDGGTHDYNELDNKPKINGHTLEGNKTNEQLGIPVYTEGTGITLSGNTISADTDVLATKADLNSKQNVIADLPQIRSGAEAGATAVQPEDLARIATTGSYNDSLDKPSVNNVALIGNISLDALGIQPKGNYALESEIPDVSNFITNTVDNLVNYYKKSETFTKQEVNDLISAITTMDIRVVQTLPTEDISTTTIYFVPKTTAGTNDVYDEYVYVSNAWEHIGSTDIDLSGYQTKIDSSHKLSSDLVDDTNQTNKFVTENEKTTWNTEIENLQEEDELLKRNLQTTTGSGEEVTLEKTAELDFVKPPLPRGNTKQNTTTGKNLLPPLNSGSLNGLTFTTNSNGITTISGTTTSVITYFKNVNKILPAGTYTLSINLSYTPPANSSQLILQDINNVRLATINLWKITSKTFTLSADTEIKNYYLFSNSGIQHNGTISIQLEKGSTATSYEPYTGGIPSPNPSYPQEVEVVTGNVGVTISNENNTESKTLPVSLGNIELCKIGNYQDYLYKNNGKWYKYNAINKSVFNGSENWNYNAQNNVAYLQLLTKVSSRKGLFSNLFSYYTGDWTTAPDNTISEAVSSNFIFIKSTVASENPAWKSWLSTHNTILYYVLATPTDTEITDTTLISQLEEISKTLSYQGQTNITSNTIALFDVEAYQDLKIILEDIYKAFPTDTASGAVASFTDGADNLPLKSLIVNIDPIQDTSQGDPSPENICPISGWTGMQLNANGTVIPISWQTEAGTVYGGTLDVTTGVLTVNRAMVDLGAKNWYSSTAAGRTRFRTSITDIERISSPNIVAPMLCSNYPTKTANQTYQGTTGISLQQNEADVYVYDAQRESMTTADFKTAMSGVQLCYKLATPQTYQLTPTEVTTLLGDNTIWADTGDTTAEYRADTKLYINKMIGDAET